MHKISSPPLALTFLSALSLGASTLSAQTAPDAAGNPANENSDEDVVVLSPFEVNADEDTGYLATSTLAGSRVRTELKDLASSITVITKDFMDTIGAVNNTSLLTYTTNTEVGGLTGNFAGIGNPYVDGSSEGPTNLLRPQTNTRVRGLDSADNLRDYFATDIPWDGYNIGRVDMQRGPNSILFGIGSPAGIINASVNTATYQTEGSIQNRIDRFGSMRNSLDYNYVLIPEQLSIRVSGVYDRTKYRQKQAFNNDRRYFGALRWDPKLFGKDSSARTSFKAYYEHGDVKANRPRGLPPIDRITPFFDADKINKQFIDSEQADAQGLLPYRTSPGAATNYWLGGRGAGEWYNPVVYFDNTATAFEARQGRPKGDFAPDGASIAFGNWFPVGIATYNQYASEKDKWGPQNGLSAEELDLVAGGKSGFYKTTQITDPDIFDFYNNLLDGPNKREWQGWEAYNLSIEQTFFHDRLGFQAVYDHQNYNDGNEGLLGWSPSLSVDIQKYNMQYPGVYTDLAVLNPNAGRVYTTGQGSGNSRRTERENIRITAFGELRAQDFLGKGWLSSLLGHHTITGLYSREQYDVEDRSWKLSAASADWASLIIKPGDTVQAYLDAGNIEQFTYLTDASVVGYDSASQLHLSPINYKQTPPSTMTVQYFDSHWKWSMDPTDPTYVDPTAVWTNPTGQTPSASTQASNPANYVGWRNTTVDVLNVDDGDIESLYRDGTKSRKIISSEGVTWQAYFLDDTIVATAGWRKDRLKARVGYPETSPLNGIPELDYGLRPQDPTAIDNSESISWGVVVHLPKKLRDRLPAGTNISFGINDGNNGRVQNRYGFDGLRLPNAKGHSRDYSVVISTLNDRLSLKVAHYETTVTDANISTVTSEASTLGNSTGELKAIEVQATASALMMIGGMDGAMPGWDWYWNWANISGGYPNSYNDSVTLNDPAFWSNPETIKAQAAAQSWLEQMMPQSWFDAFGYDVNVAEAKAGHYNTAIKPNTGGWQPTNYLGGLETTPGAGRVNGEWPTGTVDNMSKGWEFELVGRPLKNWDISINASKQYASQTALGENLVTTIEALKAKFDSPAGDLRRWWGGDRTFRESFNETIWAAYQFQKETVGKLVGEMAPWRFNVVNNYHFEKGLLKGANIGFGYRWQDGTILGYALNETRDNLDVDKPYWSKSEDYIDIWAGYERAITDKVKWRIQLNLGSVGKKPRLVPYNVQPDGTPGQYRIAEGMTWQLTNTFSF